MKWSKESQRLFCDITVPGIVSFWSLPRPYLHRAGGETESHRYFMRQKLLPCLLERKEDEGQEVKQLLGSQRWKWK